MRYEIVSGSTAARGFASPACEWWIVVAYDDDETVLGGDAHWVRRELADAAKRLYVVGALRHGANTLEGGQMVVADAKAHGWKP